MGASSVASQLASNMGIIYENNSTQYIKQNQTSTEPNVYQTEIMINDFPMSVRWKVTHTKFLKHITEITGVVVIVRGKYFKPNDSITPEDRKLYLHLEGPKETVLLEANKLIREEIYQSTEKAIRKDELIVN